MYFYDDLKQLVVRVITFCREFQRHAAHIGRPSLPCGMQHDMTSKAIRVLCAHNFKFTRFRLSKISDHAKGAMSTEYYETTSKGALSPAQNSVSVVKIDP